MIANYVEALTMEAPPRGAFVDGCEYTEVVDDHCLVASGARLFGDLISPAVNARRWILRKLSTACRRSAATATGLLIRQTEI